MNDTSIPNHLINSWHAPQRTLLDLSLTDLFWNLCSYQLKRYSFTNQICLVLVKTLFLNKNRHGCVRRRLKSSRRSVFRHTGCPLVRETINLSITVGYKLNTGFVYISAWCEYMIQDDDWPNEFDHLLGSSGIQTDMKWRC